MNQEWVEDKIREHDSAIDDIWDEFDDCRKEINELINIVGEAKTKRALELVMMKRAERRCRHTRRPRCCKGWSK